MHSWRGFLKKIKKYDGVYEWTPTSEAFYRVIKDFIRKEDKILEFGSSTGHISYRLAKEGYNVTLLDIRREPIETAKNIFKKNHIKANFVCGNIFDFNDKYDIAWNSGLIQCYNNNDKYKMINKLASITNRILVFYPDIENPNKNKGINEHTVPGVGDAKEYDINRIPEIIYAYFSEILFGIIKMNKIGLNFDMYWIYAKD
jgi:SAM-dependent methyltransferase